MDVGLVTIIILLYVESEQLIRLTFTKIYLYCKKATEKGSKLDPVMFRGQWEVPRLHPCILPRGLFKSPILNKHAKVAVLLRTRGVVTLRLSPHCLNCFIVVKRNLKQPLGMTSNCVFLYT